MIIEHQSRTIEQTIAAIEALDLEPIKFKLMAPEGDDKWTQEQANANEQGYRRFLILLAKYPGEALAPHKDVDKFWHGHILDTMKYAEDCQNTFGFFLHHFPYLGMRDEEDAVERIESAKLIDELSLKEFGVYHYGPETRRDPEIAYSAAVGVDKIAAYSAAVGVDKVAAYSAAVGIDKVAAYSAAVGIDKVAAYSAAVGIEKVAAYSAAVGVGKVAAYSAAVGVEKVAAYSAAVGVSGTAAYSAALPQAAMQDKMRTWFRPRSRAAQ